MYFRLRPFWALDSKTQLPASCFSWMPQKHFKFYRINMKFIFFFQTRSSPGDFYFSKWSYCLPLYAMANYSSPNSGSPL